MLTKDQLFETVWDGTIVSESALTSAIKELRRALGDESRSPRYIESVYGRGYRLLPPVTQSPAGSAAIAQEPEAAASPVRLSRRSAIVSGVGLAAVAGFGGWWLLKPGHAEVRRIAVLPFVNLSGAEDQAYFAEGIAEEVRSALSRIGLEVIGRDSSKSVEGLDSRAAARRLGVANILTGSVRRSPDAIRVTAQLVSGEDGVERWTQSYQRPPGDEIAIQTDIAANVAQALDIILSQGDLEALNRGGTTDSLAQDYVLQARQLRRSVAWNENLQKCLSLVASAIARDPDYAMAHSEKSTLLIILAMQAPTFERMTAIIAEADRAADRALAIAPTMGVAHLAKFGVEQARLNFTAALDHLRRALALSPDDADILNFSPQVLMQLGKEEEALRLADRAIAIDPLNAEAYWNKGVVKFFLREYSQTLQAAQKALEIAPENPGPYGGIGTVLWLQGQTREALSAFHRLSADDPMRLWGEALVAIRTGDTASAESLAAELGRRTFLYQQAQLQAQLGQKQEAFATLAEALVRRDPSLIALKVDPIIDPLRDDRRYVALLRTLNFPG